MKKVKTMFFEERVVTHEKLHIPFSWQMTLRLGLNKPPCGEGSLEYVLVGTTAKD